MENWHSPCHKAAKKKYVVHKRKLLFLSKRPKPAVQMSIISCFLEATCSVRENFGRLMKTKIGFVLCAGGAQLHKPQLVIDAHLLT